MPRQRTTHPFDLFFSPPAMETDQIPQWQTLPEETRLRPTRLMVRLILDHLDGDRVVQREGLDHDA